MTKAMRLHVSTFLALAVLLASGASAQQQPAHVLPKVEKVNVNTPVTLTDNGESWTIDNGIVKATVTKRDGNISALVYHGVNILTRGREWEQVPSGTITSRITIDPATNGGERAEVAVKGINPGGAGGRGGGMDIETRITMERGTSGFYTYDEYTHKASYPFIHRRRASRRSSLFTSTIRSSGLVCAARFQKPSELPSLGVGASVFIAITVAE